MQWIWQCSENSGHSTYEICDVRAKATRWLDDGHCGIKNRRVGQDSFRKPAQGGLELIEQSWDCCTITDMWASEGFRMIITSYPLFLKWVNRRRPLRQKPPPLCGCKPVTLSMFSSCRQFSFIPCQNAKYYVLLHAWIRIENSVYYRTRWSVALPQRAHYPYLLYEESTYSPASHQLSVISSCQLILLFPLYMRSRTYNNLSLPYLHRTIFNVFLWGSVAELEVFSKQGRFAIMTVSISNIQDPEVSRDISSTTARKYEILIATTNIVDDQTTTTQLQG